VWKLFFCNLLLAEKQKVSYWYEFEFLNKSDATAVAMAPMTCQHGDIFGFI
jgi:hypothetical protein